MKLKRVLGFFSIVSVAALTTACKKEKKAESVFANKDFLNFIIEQTDSNKGFYSPKTATVVLTGEIIEEDGDYIVLEKDGKYNYYLVDDAKDELKLLKTGDDEPKDIDDLDECLLIETDSDDNGYPEYEIITAKGEVAFSKTEFKDFDYDYDSMSMGIDPFETNFDVTEYEITGILMDDTDFNKTFYVKTVYDNNSSMFGYDVDYEKTEVLTLQQVQDLMASNNKVNGGFEFCVNLKVLGLDGYYMAMDPLTEVYTVYDKNGAYCYELDSFESRNSTVMGNGKILYQDFYAVKEGTKDAICYEGDFYTYKTYQMDLKTGKKQEIKFDYLIAEIYEEPMFIKTDKGVEYFAAYAHLVKNVSYSQSQSNDIYGYVTSNGDVYVSDFITDVHKLDDGNYLISYAQDMDFDNMSIDSEYNLIYDKNFNLIKNTIDDYYNGEYMIKGSYIVDAYGNILVDDAVINVLYESTDTVIYENAFGETKLAKFKNGKVVEVNDALEFDGYNTIGNTDGLYVYDDLIFEYNAGTVTVRTLDNAAKTLITIDNYVGYNWYTDEIIAFYSYDGVKNTTTVVHLTA